MHKDHRKRIVAVTGDLFFTVKIRETAKHAGIDVEFAKSEKDVLEMAKTNPLLIILDMGFSAIEPLKLIGKLKGAAEFKGISLIGYISHVEGELKQKAHDAGCDMVMARSAFSQNLPQILKRHAELR
jgi:PleD family two-component response regulator